MDEAKQLDSKKRKVTAGCLLAAGLLVLVIGAMFGPMVWHIYSVRHFMLKTVNHPRLALACLDLMTNAQYSTLHGQWLDRRYTAQTDDILKLPMAIREINPQSVLSDTDSVMIVMSRDIGFTFFPKMGETGTYQLTYVPYLPGGKEHRVLWTLKKDPDAEPTPAASPTVDRQKEALGSVLAK